MFDRTLNSKTFKEDSYKQKAADNEADAPLVSRYRIKKTKNEDLNPLAVKEEEEEIIYNPPMEFGDSVYIIE